MTDRAFLEEVRRWRVHIDHRRNALAVRGEERHPRAIADLTILGLLHQIESAELNASRLIDAMGDRRLRPVS